MKRVIAGIVVVGLLGAVLAVPTPAYAQGHRGHFWGGVAIGAVTGLAVGSIFAPFVYAAPPVVYQPAPVYVQPVPVVVYPGPVCFDRWVDTYWNGYGWTAGHWERTCR